MSSLPSLILLGALAATVYHFMKKPAAAPGEDFLIQDPTSQKITDQTYIDDMKAGRMGWNGTRFGGAQYY